MRPMELSIMKDKNLAAILACLFGCTGIHWIYLQRQLLSVIFISINLIIVYTGFWKAYIPLAVISCVNSIRIATMNWNEFNVKYNRRK